MNLEEKIKKLVDRKIWLAPLAGYTDKAFRTICKENEADVVVTEMVSAAGLTYNSAKTFAYADFLEKNRPVGIQLFGSKPENFVEAIDKIIDRKPDFIDINMGCPMRRIVNNGSGSAMLLQPQKAFTIVEEMKKQLEKLKIPLSVKIRSGWDEKLYDIVAFAKGLEAAGADILIVHPRTRKQMFTGKSDWEIIRVIKNKLTIPVVGNGDITTVGDALEMFEETECDSVMIGRGALGQPWIFSEIKSFLLTNRKLSISYSKKIKVIEKHLKLAMKYDEKRTALLKMRKHFTYYTKGYPDSSKVRKSIYETFNPEVIINEIGRLFCE